MLVTFAVGGLAVATGMGLLTYAVARGYLIAQRQSSATAQARANARLVAATVRAPGADISRLLSSLETPTSSRSVVLQGRESFSSSLGVGPDALPTELRRLVARDGVAARQWARVDGDPVLVVGIPLRGGPAYFEIFPLQELARTLLTLRWAVVVAAATTTVGSTLVGIWASRRVLEPVRDVARAASAIAAGALDTRLAANGGDELADVATAFNSMVDSLQLRMERDGRFASSVSHELRSPLTTLLSAVQVLQRRRDRLDARTARAVDLLAREVARFERLVTDLLEISRFDAGAADASFEEVALDELVRHAVARDGDVVAVSVDAPRERLLVQADKRRLEQVVVNLLDNARTHAGGATRVQVGNDGVPFFAVEDHGPGVAPEDRERVFERFSRGSRPGPSSRSGGAGLGLALVVEHVRLHGGRVSVEDGRHGGSRFVVELRQAPR